MDFLSGALEELLIPLTNSGVVGVLAILLLIAVIVLKDPLQDAINKKIKPILESGHWLRFILLYLVLPIVALIAGFGFTFAIMMAAGVAVLLIAWKRPKPLLTRRFIVAQVAGFFLLLVAEQMMRTWSDRSLNDRLVVYSMLSVDASHPEKEDLLFQLTGHYRRTLSNMFLDLDNVRIQPTTIDLKTYQERLLRRGDQEVVNSLLGDKPRPDLVVKSTVNINSAGGRDTTFILVSELMRFDRTKLQSIAWSRVDGSLKGIQQAFLRSLFALMNDLQRDSSLALPMADEERVKRNVLNAYMEYLKVQTKDDVVARVRKYATLSPIPVDSVLAALNAWPPLIDDSAFAAREAMLRATNASKVFQQ